MRFHILLVLFTLLPLLGAGGFFLHGGLKESALERKLDKLPKPLSVNIPANPTLEKQVTITQEKLQLMQQLDNLTLEQQHELKSLEDNLKETLTDFPTNPSIPLMQEIQDQLTIINTITTKIMKQHDEAQLKKHKTNTKYLKQKLELHTTYQIQNQNN